jgi:putative acetyltransferase
MEIREGGLRHPAVVALLRHHLAGMQEQSPPESVHALDLAGLAARDIRFFAAWEGDELLGVGALRKLDPRHGEIKSMRTAPGHLRKSVAARLLDHIMTAARRAGMTRISLETGTTADFDPALALYRRFGFSDCAAFGDYPAGDPFSRFMSRAL